MGLVKKRHVEKIEDVLCKTDYYFEVINYASNIITFHCGTNNQVCILTALDYPSTKIARSGDKSCLVINMSDEEFLYFYNHFVDDDKAERYVKRLQSNPNYYTEVDVYDDRYVLTFNLRGLKLSSIIESIDSVFYLDSGASDSFDLHTKNNKCGLVIYREKDFITFCEEYFGIEED